MCFVLKLEYSFSAIPDQACDTLKLAMRIPLLRTMIGLSEEGAGASLPPNVCLTGVLGAPIAWYNPRHGQEAVLAI